MEYIYERFQRDIGTGTISLDVPKELDGEEHEGLHEEDPQADIHP